MRSTTTIFLIWGKVTSIDQASSPGEKTADRFFFFTIKNFKGIVNIDYFLCSYMSITFKHIKGFLVS